MAYVLNRESAVFGVGSGWPMGFLGLADAPAPFGGDPVLQQWARDLAATWAKRVRTKPDEQQRFAQAKEKELDRDMQVTLAAADKRARRTGKKHGTPAILQAWRISRREQMDFKTLDRSPGLPTTFRPPASPVQRVATPLIEGSEKAPVALLTIEFVKELRRRYDKDKLRVDTYPDHGGKFFSGRGFSIDLWLDCSPKDARGFYQPKDAVALLRTVHEAARAVGAEWRVLYNDYSVARVINQETGARRVAFVGGARPGGSLNWHGPHPLLLHFHLDLAPLPGVAAGTPPTVSSSPAQPGGSKAGVTESIASLPKILADAVRRGALTFQAVTRILTGERNMDTLSNLVFYARHPELPSGYKIKPSDRGLAREWLDIRDRVVEPVLRALDARPASPPAVSTPVGTDLPRAPLGTLIAEVPGRSRFSYAFTPEDLLWTARFLKGEAGGENSLDNHAVIWAMLNRYALFTHKYYPTFHQFLRAYSTPLQPVLKSWGAARRHMHKNTFVRTGGTYAPDHHPEVPKGQLKQHLDLQQAPWSRLPPGARTVAQAALTGHLRNPIGLATEFGSTRVYFHDRHGRYPSDEEWRKFTEAWPSMAGKKWVWVGPIPRLNQKRNALFIQAAVARLPPDTVRVQGPD